jgi:hypothetical protein
VGWNGTSLEAGLTTKLFNVVVFGQIGNMLLVDIVDAMHFFSIMSIFICCI